MKQIGAHILPIFLELLPAALLPTHAVMAQSPKTMYLNLQKAEHRVWINLRRSNASMP